MMRIAGFLVLFLLVFSLTSPVARALDRTPQEEWPTMSQNEKNDFLIGYFSELNRYAPFQPELAIEEYAGWVDEAVQKTIDMPGKVLESTVSAVLLNKEPKSRDSIRKMNARSHNHGKE